MNKKTITSAFDYIALKLKVLVKEKESNRRKLEVAAEELKDKAEALADTAKEKEDVRLKLETTAKALAVTAKDKEDIRKKLAVAAKEKEEVRQKLVVTAKELAETAREKEDIRLKLEITAEILATTAEEKEDVRKKLEVTAEELKEKAESFAVTAKEKEDVRKKLAVTAENLATTAEEKEDVRKKLEVTAEELRKSRETLEEKVLDRTKDLEEAKAKGDEERSKLQVLIDNLPVGVLTVKAPNGEIITVNPRGRELLGRGIDPKARKEGYSQIYATVKEDGTPYPNDELPPNLVLATGHPVEKRDVYIKRPDGSRMALKASGVPVKDATGKLLFVTVVFDDITKEKEVDKAKSEFVSIASHELRTPLTAIDGLVSMMLDGEYGEVSKNLKQPLEDVNTSSERLINLVNDLLNLSRIQAGRLKYTLSEFSIADVITEVVHLLQPLSKQKGLQLTATKIDPITVQGDSDKVKQILNNLIGNSLKFTDKGSITVSTKLNEDTVEIDVTDTGIGITKEDQSKLFGQFVQLESGQGKPAGTGLGLHISKEVVRKMGGDLWIEKSEVGKGSTFAFSIPLAKSSVALKAKKEIEKEIKLHLEQKSDIIKPS